MTALKTGWHDREERWYLLDVYRKRSNITELKAAILRERERWYVDKVLIEDSAMGSSILQEFRQKTAGVYLGVAATIAKLDRFIPHTDWIRQGHLVVPTDKPWFDLFRRELLAFPDSDYDDQVDALTQFADYMKRRQGAYLDTDGQTGRRLGRYRPSRPRREDRMLF